MASSKPSSSLLARRSRVWRLARWVSAPRKSATWWLLRSNRFRPGPPARSALAASDKAGAMNVAVATGEDPVRASASPWLAGGRAFALLGCYFLLQTLFRTLVSDSAELDESEQLLWAQAWQWGYGSDPPLYTWLQIL